MKWGLEYLLLICKNYFRVAAKHMPMENLDSRYQKYKHLIKNFTIMDDIFMRNVLKNQDCTEYILQVILENKQLKILDQVLQKDYKNLQGRSAVLDCVAKDSEGKQIDIEIQQDNEGASPKRARYHSGLIDMNTLEPGQDFDKLPESYIIFITKKDILGQNLPIYHIDRKIRETQDYFNDESHIIYVNSKIQDDTELGRLMHDFNCKNPQNMYNKILANRVSELKETAKGVDTMSHEMEQLFKELCKEEIKENTLSMSVEMAANMAADGIPIEKIAQYLKVDTTTVKKWLDKKI